jgi:23S rRNA pseudouridine2605 synthase
MRLVKFLALSCLSSRRKALDLVKQKKVKIKRRLVLEHSPIKLILKKSRCSLRTRKISSPKVYYLFHKPRGYLTSLYDTIIVKP